MRRTAEKLVNQLAYVFSFGNTYRLPSFAK